MRLRNTALIAIALLALSAFASASYAGLTMQWGPGQVYFEIYRGSNYYYAQNPYYYYGNNYYYFPYNFRYYYNTQWYYYPSGWFYYNGYNNWYRDNAWVFYENYWYYPRYNYYYYPTYFDPKIVTVQQIDTPYCSDIDIATHTINVKEGQTVYDTFWIENKSNFVFDISSIVVLENDSEIDVQPYQSGDFIPENGSAELSIRTQADSGIQSKLTTAYVQVEGVFSSTGKSCSFSDTRESFTASVKGTESAQSASFSGTQETGTSVDIDNFAFMPSEITINKGDTVTWANNDSVAHTATADNGEFDTGTIQPGEQASITFNQAGTFNYYCSLHPSMTARITVVDSTSNASINDSTYSGSESATVNNYYYYPPTQTQQQAQTFEPKTSCSSISTFTKNFYLGSNDSRTQNFIVKNNSDKAFYVESIQAFDNSPDFATSALSASKTSINVKGSITVPVKIESFENASEINSSATFKISGTFEDNSHCTADSIGNNDFAVVIIPTETAEFEQARASDFQISIPDTVQVPASGTQFRISLTNYTGKSGYVKVYSPDIIVEPQAVSIPAIAETITQTITLKELDKDSAWLFYDIFLPGVSIPSRVSKLVKSTPTAQITPQPAPTPIVPSPQVSIGSEITPQIDGSYDLNITVINQNNYPISGSAGIDVPEDWSIEGNNQVSLNPGESKSILLKARPANFNTEDVKAVVEFKSTSGFRFSQPILLKANTPFYAAAFAILGANSFFIGILILFIIVVLAAHYAIKKNSEKAVFAKTQWQNSAK